MQLRWLMRRIMPRALLYSRVLLRAWFLHGYLRRCLSAKSRASPCPWRSLVVSLPIDLRVPLYPSGELSAALKSPFQPASWTSYLHAASINLCPSPSLHVTRARTKARIEMGKGKQWLHGGFSRARFKTLFSTMIAHCYVTQAPYNFTTRVPNWHRDLEEFYLTKYNIF